MEWEPPVEAENHQFTPKVNSEVNNITEFTNLMEIMVQECPPCRWSPIVIWKPVRYSLVGEACQAISLDQEDDPTLFTNATVDKYTEL